jgi:hypothetical protein
MSENRSITVKVFNNLPSSISLVTNPAATAQGTWDSPTSPGTGGPPPSQIAWNSSWTGTLQNSESPGATGSFAYLYTAPSGAVTTFQFTFGCPDSGSNTAAVTAGTTTPDGGTHFIDYSYALPFTTTAGSGNQLFCKIASGNPVTVEFYLSPRIVSVAAAPGTSPTAVLNWDGAPVATSSPTPIWTPTLNYDDGSGGSTNPLVFPQTISSGFVPKGQSHCFWLRAMVMSDLATVDQGNVVLSAPMTEVITGQTITFESAQTTSPPSLSPTAIDLYAVAPSSFQGLACISTIMSGDPVTGSNPSTAGSWYLQGKQGKIAVGRPLLEIYWLLNPPGPMWSGGVWVRTLRDIFKALAGAKNPSVATSPAATITSNCFTGSTINSPNGGKVYEENGSAAFCQSSKYNLWAYYNAPSGQTVNCEDQAGFLQVCLGAVGIQSTLLHLQPFGFVNNTVVVGNPTLLCNSPDWYVYGRTATAAALVPADQEPPDAPATNEIPPQVANYPRIWWQDHWVVLQYPYPPPVPPPMANVLDATLGPYCEPGVTSYINAAIDTSTAAQRLYKYWTAKPPPPLPTQWTSYTPAPLKSATLVGPNNGQPSDFSYSPGFTSVQVNQS